MAQKKTDSASKQAKDKLAQDVGLVVQDAQELMDALGGDLDEGTQEALKRLRKSLASVRDRYDDAEERVRDYGAEKVKRTDELIREYPYQAIGVSFGVGVLLGLVFSRK